jgi:hypothetical protein
MIEGSGSGSATLLSSPQAGFLLNRSDLPAGSSPSARPLTIPPSYPSPIHYVRTKNRGNSSIAFKPFLKGEVHADHPPHSFTGATTARQGRCLIGGGGGGGGAIGT